jgi:hypothetical protein
MNAFFSIYLILSAALSKYSVLNECNRMLKYNIYIYEVRPIHHHGKIPIYLLDRKLGGFQKQAFKNKPTSTISAIIIFLR